MKKRWVSRITHGQVERTVVAALVMVVAHDVGVTAAQDAPVAMAQAAQEVQTEVTYARDVAPILQKNCMNCHRPGAAGPMSLLTYEEVRPWASLIKDQVERREMPPGWYIDPTVGIQEFKNNPSLSAKDIDIITRWVDSGARMGNPADLPEPIVWRDPNDYWEVDESMGWGPPDVIIESPPYTVAANGQDQWWMPDIDLPQITEARWIRAVETRPRDFMSGYVFHHANTNLLREGGDWEDDEAHGLAEAAVGKRMDLYPDDSGKLIVPGDRARFRLHLFPMGEEVKDAGIQVGLWFHPKGQDPEFATEDERSFGADESRGLGLPRVTDLLIPPHGSQMLRGVHVLSQNARIHSVRGHMHLRGAYQSVEVIYPNGRREVLNKINWRHNWHTTHIYQDHVQPLVPKGSVLIFTSLYDNTANNPSNPDPDQWVTFARRSANEMSHVRLGITYFEDDDFARLVAQRKELLKQREITYGADANKVAARLIP